MKTPPKKKPEGAAEPLVPQRFAYIFDHCPVLWFEDKDAYDALSADYFAHYAPEDIIDYHSVKEMLDEQWEINRIHRIRKACIETEMPGVIVEKLGPEYWAKRIDLGVNGNKEELTRYALKATKGISAGRKLMDDLLKEVEMRYDDLLYRTVSSHFLTSSVLNERLERAERRLEMLNKKYYERRTTIGAMRRSLIDRQKATDVADAVVVKPVPKDEPKE